MATVVGGGAQISRLQGRLWILAQTIVLLITLALIARLWWAPDDALALLWELLIPVLPASFLLSPMLWRNICPLATLNRLPGRLSKGLVPSVRFEVLGGTIAIVLLAVLVIMRRIWFNANGPLLAAVILAVAVAALALGMVFEGKSGFCNSLCPVLPVERLYGQRPLLNVANARCIPCNGCTRGACIDLVPRTSAVFMVGTGSDNSWLLSAYGVFATVFPGFVLAYFTSEDVAVAAAGPMLLRFAVFCAASCLLVNLAVRLGRIRKERALPLLGGLTVGIYYWFAAPRIATYVGIPDPGGLALRMALLLLVAAWLRVGTRGPARMVAATH